MNYQDADELLVIATYLNCDLRNDDTCEAIGLSPQTINTRLRQIGIPARSHGIPADVLDTARARASEMLATLTRAGLLKE